MSIWGEMLSNLYPSGNPSKPQSAAKTSGKESVRSRAGAAASTASASSSSASSAGKVGTAHPQVTPGSGELLRAQVVDLRSGQITVQLENGAYVSARTAGTLELAIGQKANFYVSETAENQIVLKLAKEEGSAENPAVDKALLAAGLQRNDRTVSIVTSLLDHLQPASGANIRHFMMLSAKYSELPVNDLILMELHGLPINKETVEQFSQYRKGEHQLFSQMEAALNDTLSLFSQLPDGETKQALLKELALLLPQENGKETASSAGGASALAALPAANTSDATTASQTAAQPQAALASGLSNAAKAAHAALDPVNGTAVQNSSSTASPSDGMQPNSPAASNGMSTGTSSSAASQSAAAHADGWLGTSRTGSASAGASQTDGIPAASQTGSTSAASQADGMLTGTSPSGNELKNTILPDGARPDASSTDSTSDAARRANAASSDAARHAVSQNAAASSTAASSIHAPGAAIRSSALPAAEGDFLRFLRDALTRSFLLKPEDVADKEKVKKYYRDLEEQTIRLEQISKKAAEALNKDLSSGNTGAKQLRSNLSFMDGLNQVFPFLQLPLKMKEARGHGELYVYERKRAMTPSDSVSALLHLELDALGTTDIFVSLRGKAVSTKFYMSAEDAKQLVLSDLHLLSDALAKKGYSLQSEVALKENATTKDTLLEQFLEEKSPSGLNRYTFDIRA